MPPRAYRTTSFGSQTAGPVTKGLCIAIIATALLATLAQRSFGLGTNNLNFQVPKIFSLELWRLVTYPFVDSSGWGLIINVIVLWFFGGWFESRWGSRDFLRFFFFASIGAALLAVPLSYLANLVLPFRDLGLAEGPGAALDAMLVALAVTTPDSNVLFGFVLPVRARTLVLIMIGIQVVIGIQSNAATLSITLGGMAMGYLLVTGAWRPRRLLGSMKSGIERRRRSLHVVPPRDRTLH